MKECTLCGENFPINELNEYGECRECVDEAEAKWGF